MRHATHIVTNREQLAHVLAHFSKQNHFVWDVETIGDYKGVPTRNEIAWLGLSTSGMDVTIPVRHPIGDRVVGEEKVPRADKHGKIRNFRQPVWEPAPPQLRPSVVFEVLEPLFESDRLKIAQNLVFDAVSVAKYRDGRPMPGPYHDTLVSSWLLDENRLNGLKPRVKAVYGTVYDTGNTGRNIATTAFSQAARYNILDVRFERLLYHRNLDGIATQRLDRVCALEHDLLPALISMALEGAPVDLDALHGLRDHLELLIQRQEGDVYRAAQREFNLNSAQQVAHVLFDPTKSGGQGLKHAKLTNGGRDKQKARQKLDVTDYSTKSEVLESLAGNPVVDALLTYRETHKLLSTYVYGYLGDPSKKDRPCQIHNGRIYTTFKQYGTVTGRFSSAEPNLQNIPRPSTDLGKRIRGLFVAPPGYKLVVADYGQIELVLLAHFAGPGALFDGFHAGIDPHLVTAAGILKCSPKDVDSEQRTVYGKTINFLIGYGGGEHLLAEKAGVSLAESKAIIAGHVSGFPEIYAYKAKLLNVARSRNPPHIRTLSGRIRRIPDLQSTSTYWRSKAERQLINSHIQGSAADLIKMAMVHAHKALPGDCKLILTVHDELVTLVPEQKAEQAAGIIRESMLGEKIQSLLTVPLTSEIKVVDRWADAK